MASLVAAGPKPSPKTFRPVIRPSRFRRASTNATVVICRNPSAGPSSHLLCVRSHRPPLNRLCRRHPGIDTRNAFSASSSSTRPQIMDAQGTRFSRDVGPRKQARFVGGHAHRTRQIGRVHDTPNGRRSHRHRCRNPTLG